MERRGGVGSGFVAGDDDTIAGKLQGLIGREGKQLKGGRMAVVVALLRAVNVGGTGKLPMAELKAMCVAEGYARVQTYIASGNVVFEARVTPTKIKAALEARLEKYAGKPVGVIVRTAEEMMAVLKANPFPQAQPNRTLSFFLDSAPPMNALDDVRHIKDEQMQLGLREIYVHYGAGMANSKLVIPAAKLGTARNMNTVAKLVELAAGL
jgi:uncharacterized protein (DUF1697 family)